jgi:hypothetical protein
LSQCYPVSHKAHCDYISAITIPELRRYKKKKHMYISDRNETHASYPESPCTFTVAYVIVSLVEASVNLLAILRGTGQETDTS